jgi:acetyl-CoA carboxylase biotin carboxylase subunit
VRYADEDVCVGPYPSAASYLNISSIVSAAEITEADAIHPGYGFLSENAYFAEILQDCHITFIGPSPDAIRKMGDKSVARRTVAAAGVPIVPGSPGPVESADEALAFANKAGYPVILKASAGGGGRGMRVARDERDLANAFETARAEAEKAFGNAEVYLEKYLEDPRIAVAAGAPLSFADRDMSPRGHAIEFRINAEDPVTFKPSPGRIVSFHPPGGLGVRVDTAAYQGYLFRRTTTR